MTKLHDLAELGQSVWLDYIRRAFIESGELQELIEAGLRGVTSNPSIFEKAIAGSADYDEELKQLARTSRSPEGIYEALAIEDIQQAADLFRPLFDKTNGQDGYVSLEVNPGLANNTQGTIAEARRLFAAVDRPNVMIKVPATPAGIPAIRALLSEGINVNVTLMFSLNHYNAVAEAYLGGLEALVAAGGDPGRVASVASFFLSRVDTAVDEQLEKMGTARAITLKGRTAIANAKVVYHRFQELFSGERWEKLAGQGARPQRVLWASTGTKDPAYPDTMYVDPLIGPYTVNTLPPATLQAFLNHGTVAVTVTTGVDEARQHLAQLAGLGINLDSVTEALQKDGVEKFAQSFRALVAGIIAKAEQLQGDWERLTARLGRYQPVVDAALREVKGDEIAKRIWAHDHTVWRPDPTEISNRLGWLHTPEMMAGHLKRIHELVVTLQAENYSRALLLGMGGSSLAPEVFYKTFGMPASNDNPYLELHVLDSTHPDAVLAYARQLNVARTLFIVSTKSGTTTETLSFFKYFYNEVANRLGEAAAGQHFIAITDPGSKLADLAQRYRFRATFLNDPNIGGRYSALSYFGLVPAALVGVDLETLLDRAMMAVRNAESCNCPVDGDNDAARLGVILGELAKAGRDKVTLVASPAVASFGDWVEQLIAESTGKEGKGILPVVGEPVGPPEVYGDDRLFVYLRLEGDHTYDAAVEALAAAGHPVVRLCLQDLYDLGEQFFLWEMATAVAGHRLGIQPFDQPNVESAKKLSRKLVDAYQQTGQLPEGAAAPLSAGALVEFLAQARPGSYLAFQAYVPPTAETEQALQALRVKWRDQTRLATTLGYGPRFLHSTGQLHKGDAGKGLFIQFSADPKQNVPIPDDAGQPESSITFGVLVLAQALGDGQALRDAGRPVIRFHLGEDVVGGLQQLASV